MNRLDKNFTVFYFRSGHKRVRTRCAACGKPVSGRSAAVRITGAEIFRQLRNANPAAFVETARVQGDRVRRRRSVVVATVSFVRANYYIVFRPRVRVESSRVGRVASGPHRQTVSVGLGTALGSYAQYITLLFCIFIHCLCDDARNKPYAHFFFFTQNAFDRSKPDAIVTNQKQTNRLARLGLGR